MNNEKKEIFREPWVSGEGWSTDSFKSVPTPTYVVSEERLEKNLQILKRVEEETGAKVLLALKGFSMYSMFPLVNKYLSGMEASSVNEARLGKKNGAKEVHVFSPSYTEENIKEYLRYADHLVFNSFSQWEKFGGIAKKKASCGIRVNLEHSEVDTPLYDPSRSGSHFGVTRANFKPEMLGGLEGLHFHNLCELGADALARSLKVFEDKFGEFLVDLKWVNFGGGHHVTREGYDLNLLFSIIKDFKKKFPHLTVYLEPGEAVALNAGVLVGSVVDIVENQGVKSAVLDVSATCHMPDVLEMPYQPRILGADFSDVPEGENVYKLVGPTCLTGDVIGDYVFKGSLHIGQKVVFLNMAIYTMVKNNTFNGVDLPKIAIMKKDGKIRVIKTFGYEDFKNRLS